MKSTTYSNLLKMLDKTPHQEMHQQMSEVLQRLKESQHGKESASADEGRPCLWAWPLISVSLCTESIAWMRGANEHVEHYSQASYTDAFHSPVSIALLMLTASIRADVVPPAINPTRSPCSPSLINTSACGHQTRTLS